MEIVIKSKQLVKNLPIRLNAKRFTLAGLILIAHVFLLSCNSKSNQKEVELLQREKAVLEKENRILRIESQLQESPANLDSQNIVLTEQALTDVFENKVQPLLEKNIKQEYLKSGGQKEGLYHFGWDLINYVVGDLNGDNIADGVVRYSYTWGGTLTTSGFAVIINDSKKLKLAVVTENYQHCIPIKISNQMLYCTKYEWADGDANCCPSIEYVTKFILDGSQLVEIN